METIGVNLGSIPSNAARGLGAKTAPSQDEEAYTKVGKTGMGDLDISTDGNTLYFVNLFEKKLHSLSTTNPTAAPGVAIPNPGCAGGDYRPWGLKIYKGSVYVGVVCDASTGSKSELRAYIYKYDISTNTFNSTPILDFPLTYPKGFPWSGDPTITGWFPWSDNINDAIAIQKPIARTAVPDKYGDVLAYPQPILSDIEFDIDGSMVLGFGDRFSLQTGNKNFAPNSSATYGLAGSTNNGYSGLVGGDILRAYSNGTTFVLENNAKAGPVVGAGPANNQGPGFGEFYNDNYFYQNKLAHSENASGGLALRPGSGETIYVAMDPENEISDSGGLRKVSNTTGQPTGAITITTGFSEIGLFAKAAALGDLEVACATPTYLEIGNRVWIDTNKDGIQDACEKSLAGVKVALYQGSTLIATTTTDVNGEYYFSNGSDVNAVSKLLQPNTVYTVRFGTDGTTSQYDAATDILTTSTGKFKLTTAFSTAPTANTLNDSNAQLSGGFLSADATTGAYGSVNHTIDAGFICAPTTVASVSVTPATCTGATANADASITLMGIVCADKAFLVTAGGSLPSYTATGSSAVSNSAVAFTGLDNPATSAGQSYSIVLYNGPCCYTVVTAQLPQVDCTLPPCSISLTAAPTTCDPATNQYSVSGSILLINNTAGGTAIITDGPVTLTVSVGINATSVPYTLTGLTSDGVGHTIMVDLSSCGSAVVDYPAPANCTPVLTVSVAVPVCNPATNNYTATGTVSLTNVPSGATLTITDNGTVISTATLTVGQTSVSFSVSGVSDASNNTVVATLTNSVTVSSSTTYMVPQSCTVCSTSLTTAALANGQVGTAYSQTITASGGTAPYTFGIIGTLPAGLNLDPVTGEISGTPTAPAGTASFTVTVSDAKSCSDAQPLTITTSNLPVCSLTATATPTACNTATNQYAVIGTISSTNAALNGATTQSLTITDGLVSTVVTLTSDGPVSYTLTGLNSDGLTHTVTVLSSATACGMTSVDYTAPVSCTVAPPALTVVVSTPVCDPATNNYTATGTVSLTNVPSGTTLTITDNGAVVSTATLTAGQTSASFSVSGLSDATSHSVVATLTDGTSASTTYAAPVSCTVCSLSLTTAALANGQIGSTYSQTLTASGGTLPYTFAVLGTLPAGLSLNPTTGEIAGTPTAPAGTASFTVTVSDAKSCTDVVTLSITTSALPVCSLTATATPTTCDPATNTYAVSGLITATNAAINGASTQSLTITDGLVSTVVTLTGDGPVSYTLSGLNSDGLMHTVTVLSSASACGMTSVDYTAPASCTVATPLLTLSVDAPVCNPATNNYTATGTVSLTNVPAGATLTITDNGAVVSTAALTAGQTSASFSVSGLSNASSHTVMATLTGGTSANTVYSAPASCTVCSLSLTTMALANGQIGTAYSQTLTASGGTAPYTFAVLGTLPAGLSLDPVTDEIAGTPTAPAGTASFTVTVSDAKSCTDVVTLSITTSALPVCSLTATATPGTCNTLTNQYTVTGIVSATNAAINGASTQSLTISVGSITTTVTFTGNGPVSYTLTGLNSDGLMHTVTMLSSATACGMTSVDYTAPASCTVAAPLLTLSVDAPVCNPATNTYTATGTVSLTNVPAGTTLTITDNGAVVSTAALTAGQTSASFSVSGLSNASSHTVMATLTGGTSATTTYAAPASCTVCSLSLTTMALNNGQIGTAYSQTLTASGGTLPYTFAVLGTLPAGLSLNPATGVLSGTPTAPAGTASFTVTVSDAKSCSDAQPLSITTSALPVCSLTATATPTDCNTTTNQYTVSGTISSANAAINSASPQSLTITDGLVSTVVTLTGDGPVSYTLTGLNSDGATHTVTVFVFGHRLRHGQRGLHCPSQLYGSGSAADTQRRLAGL